ncbi:hypothetical protein EG829_28375, partial [bacterium]|nr:hypothetical protein [bacterium]
MKQLFTAAVLSILALSFGTAAQASLTFSLSPISRTVMAGDTFNEFVTWLSYDSSLFSLTGTYYGTPGGWSLNHTGTTVSGSLPPIISSDGPNYYPSTTGLD